MKMGKFEDLTGRRFNKLLVLNFKEIKNKKTFWLCKCACGKEKIVCGSKLKNNHTKSCGCINKGNEFNFNSKDFIAMYDKKGNVCLIDYEDLERVKQYTWHQNEQGYWIGKCNSKSIRLHRFLLNPVADIIIDHKDGSPSNNRKENLRICTSQQNSFNRKCYEGMTSKYKGVYWKKDKKRWCSNIKVSGKIKYLGSFASEEEAGRRYNEEAIKLFGEYAKLNDVVDNLSCMTKEEHHSLHSSKPVLLILESGQEIMFDSCLHAQRVTSVDSSNISHVCNGARKTAGGYRWRWLNG